MNDEFVDFPDGLKQSVLAAVGEDDEYFRGWRRYFEQQDPVLFEKTGFGVVRDQLVNTKGLFASSSRYKDLERCLDTLLEFMQKNYSVQPEEPAGARKSLEQASPKELSQTQISFKPPTNSVQEVLQKYGVTHELDFTEHVFLSEYFLYLKKELTSLFVCSIVDHRQLFVRKSDSVGGALRGVSGLVPVFGSLLNLAGIGFIMMQDATLVKKLSRITDLALNYTELPDRISRILVLLRANAIMKSSSQEFVLKSEGLLSKAMKEFGLKNKLSSAQMLAINDMKIVEGVLLLLIETKQVNVINFPDINELLHKVVDALISTNAIVLEFDNDLDRRALTFAQNSFAEVVIDREMLRRNEYLPKSLLRKKNEDYKSYYDRVNKFLKVRSRHAGNHRREPARHAREDRPAGPQVQAHHRAGAQAHPQEREVHAHLASPRQ